MQFKDLEFADLSTEQIQALKEFEKKITANYAGRKVYLLAVTDG